MANAGMNEVAEILNQSKTGIKNFNSDKMYIFNRIPGKWLQRKTRKHRHIHRQSEKPKGDQQGRNPGQVHPFRQCKVQGGQGTEKEYRATNETGESPSIPSIQDLVQ